MIYTYNKLTRDKVVGIIENLGKKTTFEILDDVRYGQELDKKLVEEVNEYLADHSIEEMADVMEVIMAILNFRGISFEQVQKVMEDKRNKRGAFENKIFLKQVEKDNYNG